MFDRPDKLTSCNNMAYLSVARRPNVHSGGSEDVIHIVDIPVKRVVQLFDRPV